MIGMRGSIGYILLLNFPLNRRLLGASRKVIMMSRVPYYIGKSRKTKLKFLSVYNDKPMSTILNEMFDYCITLERWAVPDWSRKDETS